MYIKLLKISLQKNHKLPINKKKKPSIIINVYKVAYNVPGTVQVLYK